MKSYSDPISAHPLLWRGKQISHHIHTLSTGHSALDEVLPGNGWPLGAVTELVNDTTGCGELSLLLPVLAQLSQKDRWITMIDPPWIPCPSALHGRGLALEKLLLIRTQNRSESLWACEQVVRGIAGGAMLAWPETLSFGELRRLQLSAKSTRETVFLFRDRKATNTSSPATLRLQLTADDGDLRVKVLKCRGQRPTSSIHIRRSQLFQQQTPSFVNSNESDKRAGPKQVNSWLNSKDEEAGLPKNLTGYE
ncbi:MAG: translesion DNA synthesis-associated protein ImuA [Gammaproteobacteria bacterium]|nr:translesion DNA synthesis-associated protein ImuA [Gammaproteobacteria bacterium]